MKSYKKYKILRPSSSYGPPPSQPSNSYGPPPSRYIKLFFIIVSFSIHKLRIYICSNSQTNGNKILTDQVPTMAHRLVGHHPTMDLLQAGNEYFLKTKKKKTKILLECMFRPSSNYGPPPSRPSSNYGPPPSRYITKKYWSFCPKLCCYFFSDSTKLDGDVVQLFFFLTI